MKNPLLILVLVVSSGLASEKALDVQLIAGKSKPEVASVLGKPLSCSPNKYGEKCSYENGAFEIVFIKGKADWITVEALDTVQYSANAITALGLQAAKPTFKNEFTIRWEHVQGLLEVAVFPEGSTIDYAYIKVSTR